MPIYEYVCQKCGHHLEIIQKMSDKPLTRCPECRGRLEKVISQTSFQLKGSGWYVSDYGKGGTKEKTAESSAKTESAKAEKPDKAEKADTSSPAKPEKGLKKEATASVPSTSGTSTKSD
jgi:putative FmdB family regulatory protein